MDSSEPIEPHFIDDPCAQASANESWRAEVASRVHTYRARRQRINSGENSPGLDFGPATEAQNLDAEKLASRNPAVQIRVPGQSERPPGGGPRNSALPLRNAFDTNYYRRLNAESIAQSSRMMMSATAAATAPCYELEAEFEPESDVSVANEQGAEVAEVSFLERDCISEPEPEAGPPVTPPRMQASLAPEPLGQGNLILFRRPFLEPPLVPQPSRDELAEPVNRRPRILEVPEDILPAVQGSLFPEIRLDTNEQEEDSNYREPEFDVPLRVARVSERLIASLTDMSVVMAASLLFAAIAWRALPDVPHTKPFFMVLGAVTLPLWAIYHHLFLLFAGRTPGMWMRGIRLLTFDGRVPQWKQRGTRARYMFISFASVALGFLWALVDEDALCWHDRISKTFLSTE